LGVCIEPTLCIITEYLEGGSLRDLLTNNLNIDHKTIVRIARSVAAGVLHLHKEGLIHRDLACRNVLVDSPCSIVRVADFGMSRGGTDSMERKTVSDVGPLKWMAPECLVNRVYSSKSDVYSYGITLWEIITKEEPWPDLEPITAAINVVEKGAILPIPVDCPLPFANIMKQCWRRDTTQRPDMTAIFNIIEEYESSLSNQT